MIAAEEKIVEGDKLVARKTKATNTLINLTIDRVLGVDNDVGATDSDAAIAAPAGTKTPLMSNKKPKRIIAWSLQLLCCCV